MEHEVIVIGGSYAGMSAALQLVRARRRVLVVDAGQRRNRVAAASHGLLTHDGTPPEEIAARGRADLQRYPSLAWLDGSVVAAVGQAGQFEVTLADGAQHRARRLVLACGVRDRLPGLPGLEALWGRRVFGCPYCHAHELPEGLIGVLGTSPSAIQQAALLPDWGPTALFLAEGFEPEARQLQLLAARRVAVVRAPLDRLEAEPLHLVLRDGRRQPLAGLFVTPATSPSPLAVQLGCALASGPAGEVVRTDDEKMTSVRGVHACGDLARASASVVAALADGAVAGMAVHRSLMFSDG